MGTRLWRRGPAVAALTVAFALSTYPANTCSGFVPAASDGWPGDHSFISIDTTPDG
jgi:hypothetical protein